MLKKLSGLSFGAQFSQNLFFLKGHLSKKLTSHFNIFIALMILSCAALPLNANEASQNQSLTGEMSFVFNNGNNVKFSFASKKMIHKALSHVSLADEVLRELPITDVIYLNSNKKALSPLTQRSIDFLKSQNASLSVSTGSGYNMEALLLVRRTEQSIIVYVITEDLKTSTFELAHNLKPPATLVNARQQLIAKPNPAKMRTDDGFGAEVISTSAQIFRESLYDGDRLAPVFKAELADLLTVNSIREVVDNTKPGKDHFTLQMQMTTSTDRQSPKDLILDYKSTASFSYFIDSVVFNPKVPIDNPNKSHKVVITDTTIRELPKGFFLDVEKLQNGHRFTIVGPNHKRAILYEGSLVSADAKLSITKEGLVWIESAPRIISLNHWDLESSFRPFSPDFTIDIKEGSDKKTTSFTSGLNSIEQQWKFSQLDFNPSFTTEEQNIIQSIIDQLSQKQVKSTILVGEAGTGKTILIEEALRRLPPTWHILKLEPALLAAGTSLRGQLEEKFKIIRQASRAIPVVLFLEDISSFVNLGVSETNGDGVSFMKALRSGLSEGSIMIVGTSDDHSYKNSIGRDENLAKYFKKIETPALTLEEIRTKAMSFLRSQKITSLNGLELNTHQAERALESLIQDLAKLLPQYNEPFRTIFVLENAIQTLNSEKTMSTNLPAEALQKTVLKMLNVFSSDYEMNEFMLKAKKSYKKEIRGTDPFLNIMEAAYRNSSLLRDSLKERSNGPLVKMLLAGPPGGGKTHRIKAFAAHYNLPIFEITQGFVETNPDFMGLLAEFLQKNPRAIILLDEVDRYPDHLKQQLLPLLSEKTIQGVRKINGSKKIFRANTGASMVLATSNAGYLNIRYEERIQESRKQGIGFTPPVETQVSARSQYIADSLQQARQSIKEKLGDALYDRFNQNIVEITLPDEKTYRRAILARIFKENGNQTKSQMIESAKASSSLLFAETNYESALHEFIPPRSAWALARYLAAEAYKRNLSVRGALDMTEKYLNEQKSKSREQKFLATKENQRESVLMCNSLFK